MTKLYIDTNIFLDAIGFRKNLFGKDIAAPASKLFFRSISCEFHIIISTWTLEELYKHVDSGEIKTLFAFLKRKIITANHNKSDIETAKQKSSNNFDDALHILIAERENADTIITRNIIHFLEIGTKIPIKKPENI
ncbi:MAG: type II toxin-antitoxin system VapC family toxin [Candidatus Aenigmarchaeota archaeon]|nr:type II toxin-antitoxin system VapC family toxin [Candidatus Aenigmarchaeota archaeon]